MTESSEDVLTEGTIVFREGKRFSPNRRGKIVRIRMEDGTMVCDVTILGECKKDVWKYSDCRRA